MRKLLKKRINKVAEEVCRVHQNEIRLKGPYGGAILPKPFEVYMLDFTMELCILVGLLTVICFTSWTGLLYKIGNYLETPLAN